MTGLLLAAWAASAVLLAAGPQRPRPRPLPGRSAMPAAASAPVLAQVGRAVRRLAGRRPDPRLDRRVGGAAAVVVAGVVLGPEVTLAGGAGVFLVGRWRRLRSARAAAPAGVERDLPDLVDLLALAVGAGTPVPAALPTIAPLAPASLRPDLEAAVHALSAGRPTDEVVVELGRRWGRPARALAHALSDHLRYGTPVLPALERVAAEARTARRRAAETRARRLPVLLLFPLVLCTLPAFGLLTVAPLVAGTFDSLRGGHLEAPASVAP